MKTSAGCCSRPAIKIPDLPRCVIRVGQVVVFDAWSAKEITIDGKKTYLLPEDDCLATLEPAPVIEKPAGFEAAHSVQNVP